MIFENNNNLSYRIIRSFRKTVELSISPKLELLVRVPADMKEDEISRLVQSSAEWIHRKMKEMEKRYEKIKVRGYKSGELFLWKGVEYPLQIIAVSEKKKAQVAIKEGIIVVETNVAEQEQIKAQIEVWYKECARMEILLRVKHYSQLLGETVSTVRIKNQKRRWGSCSSKRNLNFNWRLIMAPPEVLDYVIVHELCHLRHMNHSKEFWNYVSQIMPDYQERRSWLKRHGSQLEY